MQENKSCPPMPIRASPYQHQREAFAFACRLFGLTEGGDEDGKSTDTMRLVQEDFSKTQKPAAQT